MEKETGLPHGWTGDVWPTAWSMSDLDDEEQDLPPLDLQPVGYTVLPGEFFLILHSPDMRMSDSPEGHPSGVVASFRVVHGEVELHQVNGVALDLSEWIAYFDEHFPVSAWKAYAKSKMAWMLAQEDIRNRLPDLVAATSGGLQFNQAKHVLSPSADAVKRTRHRITEEHLKEVVRVYSEAVELGAPPTRAVADLFDVAHSTAAKWVGTARRNGMLEGVAQKWGTSKQ